MKTRRMWSDLRAERLANPDAEQAYEDAARAFRLGEEVHRLRLERGLSQRELAERMGVSQSVIARLEAGSVEPRISTLDRAAQALDVGFQVKFLTERTREQSIP